MVASKEKIAKKLQETQEFCTAVKGHLDENFLVEGKKIVEWKKYFKIDIPDEMSFASIVNLGQEIWIKYQRAAYFRDAQQVQLAIMEQSKSDKYNTTYNDLRADTQQKTGKPLAAESCKIAATLAVSELDNAISNQKVIHTFWVKTCDTLTELRKLLELMGYALSSDARIQKDFVVRGEH